MEQTNKYLAIILNRNLGQECDALRKKLLNYGISDVIVVDSSTNSTLKSKFVTIGAVDDSVVESGYRINRGFNLGLNYALDHYSFDWIFCFPVDTDIINLDLNNFEIESKKFPKIVAYSLPEKNNPYLPMIKNYIGLVWNILEGPILLKYELVNKYKTENDVVLFDNKNFRGFLSYKELALRVYSLNLAMGIYKEFIISEREELLLTYSELMKTETFSTNKQLLIKEGKEWLFQKYGIFDRWSFENIIRLLHDEFLTCNPKYLEISL